MSRKSQIGEVFDGFKSWAKLQTGHKIKQFQFDNAFIDTSTVWDSPLVLLPVLHQQMGTVEHRHGHLVDLALACVTQACRTSYHLLGLCNACGVLSL